MASKKEELKKKMETLTIDEKRDVLNRLVKEVVVVDMHQFNIAREAMNAKGEYGGVPCSATMNYLYDKILDEDKSVAELWEEIEKGEKAQKEQEEKKNAAKKKQSPKAK